MVTTAGPEPQDSWMPNNGKYVGHPFYRYTERHGIDGIIGRDAVTVPPLSRC